MRKRVPTSINGRDRLSSVKEVLGGISTYQMVRRDTRRYVLIAFFCLVVRVGEYGLSVLAHVHEVEGPTTLESLTPFVVGHYPPPIPMWVDIHS